MNLNIAGFKIWEHNIIHQKKEPQSIYISEVLDMAVDIISMIERTNEKSATKCFETINKIKEKYK